MRFSYRHLYYFWVAAKEGGISRAASRLGIAVQTISSQVRELERDLGHELLKPAGRRLVMTEAGEAVLRQADQIFALGEQMPELLRDATSSSPVRFAIGISDGVPKLVVNQLLQPAIQDGNLHLVCHEDEFDDLLGDLALHRLDAVLADQPASQNPNLKVYTHSLGASSLAWYATTALYTTAKRDFPQSLSRTPVLLPTSHAAVRMQLDRWFERENIKPNVRPAFVAADLLAQAEHDPGQAALVTPAAELIPRVEAALERHLSHLATAEGARKCLREFAAAILVRDLAEAAAFAEALRARAFADRDRRPATGRGADPVRGEVFLGHWTPESFGDYVAGPSHVLPTGGTRGSSAA